MESSGTDYDDFSSEPSTPGSGTAPFEPKFNVKVTDPRKDGDSMSFSVITKNIGGGEKLVERLYEDFEYLHHCLITHAQFAGVVIPPLPSKPIVDSKGAANKSKQQLGNSTKVLVADEFTKECRSLERYLSLLVSHRTLSSSSLVEEFLLRDQAAVRANVRRGMFGKLSHAVEEAMKATHKDIDEYFQKERASANEYSARIKEVLNCFSKRTSSEHRIASVYGHLATTLAMCNSNQDVYGLQCNKVFMKASEALDDAKESLYRRTCLLISYEESNKALAKAKPTKLSSAEEAKLQAEKAFEECSEVLRQEIPSYQQHKILAFQNALTMYAEAKVKTATDTNALLAKAVASIKQMPEDV